MLIISKLNKTFRIDKHDNFHVLNNINYKFEDSGVYVIYGRSGEGKTTFLNSLYGIIKYDSGEIFYNDKKIKNLSEIDAFYIPQDFGLLLKLSVYDNILLVLKKNNITKTKDEIYQYLQKFHVEDLIDKKVKYLSGGEKAKIAIIRAILSDASIILMDEPTQSLDTSSRQIVYDFLDLLSPNKLIIVSSHDANLKDRNEHNIFMQNGNFNEAALPTFKKTEYKRPNRNNKMLRYYSTFYSSKVFHFLCLIFTICLISLCLVFFNTSNINVGNVISDYIIDLDIHYIDSYSKNNEALEEVNYIYDMSLARNKYRANCNKTSDYLSYETYFPRKFVIDDTLSDSEIVLSDISIIALSKYGILDNRFDSDEKIINNAFNREIVWNDYSLKLVDFYSTKYQNMETQTTLFSNFYYSQGSYIYLNETTFKNIYSDSNSQLELNSLILNDKTINNITLYKSSDFKENEKIITLNTNDIILPISLFKDNEDVIGTSIDVSFFNNNEKITKTFNIAGLTEYTRAYISESVFNEMFLTLYDIKKDNFDITYKTNDIGKYLESINYNYSLDSLEENYVDFGINSTLNELVAKLNQLKNLYNICFVVCFIVVIITIVIINIINLNYFEDEIKKFRFLGYNLKEIYKMFLYNKFITYIFVFVVSIILNTIMAQKYNKMLGASFNINSSFISNYSFSTFIVSVILIFIEAFIFNIIYKFRTKDFY